MTAVMIGLVATDVAGLLHVEVLMINCTAVKNIDSWEITNYKSCSVGSHYDSLFVKRPSSIQVNRYDRVAKPVLLFIYRTLLSTEKGCGDYQ